MESESLVELRNIAVVIAAFVATMALLFNMYTSRLSVWTTLFQDFTNINEYIAKNHAVLSLPYPAPQSGPVNAMLIFHHLNLAYRYWHTRRLLTKEEQEAFERWFEIVFFTWVSNNPALSKDFLAIITFKDIYSESFLKWVKSRDSFDGIQRQSENQEGLTVPEGG